MHKLSISGKPTRQPPPSPRPPPISPQSNQAIRSQYQPQSQYQQQPQYQQQSQYQPPPTQSAPIVSQSNGNLNFSVNPSQIATAFTAATSLMNNMNQAKSQFNRQPSNTNGFTNTIQ